MNKEDESELLKWLQDKDISEVMNLLMRHGNRYSRRILKFFRWFCKYVPIIIMCFHAYGIYDFSQHPKDMFIPYADNAPFWIFTYISWCIFYLWFSYWQADFSFYVGDTAFHFSTFSELTLPTSWNGVGIQLKI